MKTGALLAAGWLVAAVPVLAWAETGHAGSGQVWGFGDSLVDNGNIPRLIGFFPYPPSYFDGHFSNGKVFLEYLPTLLGQGFKPSNDYGVGGAFADSGNLVGSLLPGTATEIGTARASGVRFTPRDTVVLWAGSNNDFALLSPGSGQPGLTQSGVAASAGTIVASIAADARALTALGARNLVVLNIPDLGLTPSYRGGPQQGVASSLAATEDAAIGPALRNATGGSGANVTLIDARALLDIAAADPALFGLTNVTDPCVDTPSCAASTRAQQNDYLFWDTVHPTTGVHQRIADVIANVIQAPDTIGVQAQLGLVDARAFSRLLVDRADAPTRSQVAGKVHYYVDSEIGNGHFEGRGAADGFSYDDGAVTAGAEALVAPDILVGIAGGAGRPTARLDDEAGKLDEDAYHAGIYAALVRPDWHVSTAADWTGIRSARASRPSVLVGENLDGTPNADVAGASIDASYAVHPGFARAVAIGPTGGLDFARVVIGQYDERGIAVLTQSVGGQDVASLVGHAGLRVSARLHVGQWGRPDVWLVEPVASIEATREFLDTGRVLATDFAALPIATRFAGYTATYGLARVGVAARLRFGLALEGMFTSTLARPGVTERDFFAKAELAF